MRFTPGGTHNNNPFDAFTSALLDKFALQKDMIEGLPVNLTNVVSQVLLNKPSWAELLLFVDQFEELFSLVSPHYVQPFIEFLNLAANTQRLRIVTTLRADFYGKAVEYPGLATLFNKQATYNLPAPELGALYEMITKPAVRAGLNYEEGLANRILSDTGTAKKSVR